MDAQDRPASAGSSSSSRDSTSSPKPWKNKNKKKPGSPSSIEIFEGRPAVPRPSFLKSTPADRKGYVRILCSVESEFFVPTKVVECLKCVDTILHGRAEFKENVENVIRFPDLRPEVLESVMRFVFIEHLDSLKAERYWGQNAPRATFQFEIEPDQVMEMIYAAHFFGVSNLLSVAAAMIADHLQDVPDVSSMPPDLAWCVAEQFSAQNLFDAEERQDFLSLQLDTTTLWKKHCENFLQECAVSPVPSSENYPGYDKWELSEGPPPASWKSLYVSADVQQLTDRQNGSSNKAFLDEVSYKGKWIYTHTIRGTFWDWVMTGPEGLSFSSYIAQMPNLFSLCLAKVPLATYLKGNLSSIRKILEGMPALQLLDLSETGFTSDAAVCLSETLATHRRLQVLRMAYNCILTEGYAAIVKVLPVLSSLRVLDVRENGIGFSLPEHVFETLRTCSLEELYLDGNCRHVEDVSKPMSRLVMISAARIGITSAVPPYLKCLRLQQCDLSDNRVVVLAQALDGHSTIQRIDLSDNKITSKSASAIFLWLQTNCSMVELYLGNNNITDSCATELISAIRYHSTLEKLSLMGNYSYGDESHSEVIYAAVARGNAMLSSVQRKFSLDLRSTDISFANRARMQRQAVHFTSLDLLI